MRIRPFNDSNINDLCANLINEVTQEIKALDNEYVLNATQSELEEYYIDKLILQTLIFHTDQQHIEKKEGIRVDVSHDFDRAVRPGERAIVPGTQLDLAIPYEGNSSLWKVGPSALSIISYPKIKVRTDSIVLSVSFPDDSADPEKIKSEITRSIISLENAIKTLNQAISNHNKSVPSVVKTAIQQKRELAKSTIGAVEKLGIPIKRLDKPLTFVPPVKRRKSPVKRPSVTKEADKREPELDEKEYQHILKVMRSMSLVIERSPSVLALLNEEAIRTLFLIQLNGHYEGGATGETFNASGKTDILIRVEDRNIFIAECKFWDGVKAFNDGINQLLGYLSWRDTKSALLVFNKKKDSSAVRKKMHKAMEAHPEYKRTKTYDQNGDSEYIFLKKSDSGREIIITTQLYDIPI